jgi:hypothetical protein
VSQSQKSKNALLDTTPLLAPRLLWDPISRKDADASLSGHQRSGPLSIRDSVLVRFGLEDYALTGAAVHHYADRFRKLQVADTALLFDRRLFR